MRAKSTLENAKRLNDMQMQLFHQQMQNNLYNVQQMSLLSAL